MILIVPDKFKGSYSAAEVADGVESVLKQFVDDEEIVKLPLADEAAFEDKFIGKLEEKIVSSRLVITGEGSIDSQSFSGKPFGRISELCERHRRKMFAVCGVCKCSLQKHWVKDAVQLNNFGSKESAADAFAKPSVCETLKKWVFEEEFIPKNNASIIVGCDEAGRGPLVGPVYAGAVILPKNYYHPLLKDSKKLSAPQREQMRGIIEKEAAAWCVASCSPQEIDEMNILRASITAMHRALDGLFEKFSVNESFENCTILVDGNKFFQYKDFQHKCIVKGDALIPEISAASILAKTHRDEYMTAIAKEYPEYGWDRNMGYCTPSHVEAIHRFGFTPYHRKSFSIPEQLPEIPLF